MRVKLTLLALKDNTYLPLNYNHALAGMIYSVLGNASTNFATMLHDQGFGSDGRKFKLFTFSRLMLQNSLIEGERIWLRNPTLSFFISSPLADFVDYFVAGLFESKAFSLAGAQFHLEQAETMPIPHFSSPSYFRAISPITESVRDEDNRVRYLDPNDDWSAVIEHNLVRKYLALYGKPPMDTTLRWSWDEAYLAVQAKRNKRASALIKIMDKEGRAIQVRGWLAPFTIAGNPELIALGYETGFGSRNSMGFGMAETVIERS